MVLFWLTRGRQGDSSYSKADHLTLTTAKAADGVTHEEDLREVCRAEGGAAKGLAGAELAAYRDPFLKVQAPVESAPVGRVGPPAGAGLAIEFIF